jgi:fatty-acyl-CoA synthase
MTIMPELKTVTRYFMLRDGTGTEVPDDFTDYAEAVYEQSSAWPVHDAPPRDETEPVEIFYTSGSTGKPKGVIMSSRNLYMNAIDMIMPMQLSAHDIFLHSLSLVHINGWGALHFMTACAGTQVILKKFNADEFCGLVQRHKVTLTCMVPTMLNLIAQYDRLDGFDLSTLRLIISGGAKLPMAVGLEARKKLNVPIQGSYGLTEAAPVATSAVELPGIDDRRRTKGDEYYRLRICPGIDTLDCETRVVTDNGRDVAWDGQDIGEVLVRGNVVTDGYWKSTDETDEAFTDGPVPWLHTGDLAVVDDMGYIHIVDRKKDIIIRGGENISSLEIEDVLNMHPSVLEVAVIPRPSEKWGEEPLAVVVTKPGEEQEEAKLLQYCRDQLATFKVPAAVRFINELPKSGTGKILKRELRGQLDQHEQ